MSSTKYEKQRDKIIEVASALFLSKGYNATTVNDILTEAGIAKGTFYHYFKSKDEIFDAIITKILDENAAIVEQIASHSGMTAIEKLKLIVTRPKGSVEQGINEQLDQKNDLTMHIRSYIGVAERLAPIVAKIIEQGVAERLFHTDYPLEFAEYLIMAQIMVDDEFFKRSAAEHQQRLKFMANLMEKYLNAPKGSFDFFWQQEA
jgi:AcrR family transcriptional regulator